MKRLKFIVLGMLTISFMACDKDNDPKVENPYTPIDIHAKSASLVKSSNIFGVDLYKQLLQEDEKDKNSLISPLSAFQALSMARLGANGETKDEMTDVLAYDTSLGNDLDEYQLKLVNALKEADSKVTLNIANSIWYKKELTVEPDFIKANKENYNAEVNALDFSDFESTKTTINKWVSEKTNNKIPKIVDEGSAGAIMFLINATYFYGSWKYAFDSKSTKEETFYPEIGEETKVDMMYQEAELRYAQKDNFSMVEVPYGNGHFNMVVLLPEEGKKVENIIAELSNEKWTAWMQGLEKDEVVLGLPKFKFTGDYELQKYLDDMGMPLAFSGAADFTGILQGGGICISRVKHKTFIEVDEKGTEAAAVTSVEFKETTSIDESIKFTANKSFVFAITEKDTNAILFLGKFMKPE